jgi:hypothetical protein
MTKVGQETKDFSGLMQAKAVLFGAGTPVLTEEHKKFVSAVGWNGDCHGACICNVT